MRPTWILVTALLSACAGAPKKPERFRAERPVASSPTQEEMVRRAEDLYWGGGEEFDAHVAECAKDPAVAQTLTRLMYVHMLDTEANQRRRQGTDFQLRTLEQNVPYVRARDTIARLGIQAMPVIEELIRHPRMESRRRGIEILARMPTEVLPDIESRFTACEARYRRHYVEAVARMKPCAETELKLLQWTKHEDFMVRAAAYSGLPAFGAEHLGLLCDAAIGDPDGFVQRQAVRSLGSYSQRRAAVTVVNFYANAQKENDRRGIREAERALVKISKLPPSRGGKLINYGLAHWQRWVRNLPPELEKR